MAELKGRKYTVKLGAPLLEYLFELFPGQSRKSIKSYLTNGQVLVNDKAQTAFDLPLREGDRLFILAKGVSIARAEQQGALDTTRGLGVEIIYEDDRLLVVDKASGLPTIATRGARSSGSAKQEKTVYSILTAYMKGKAHSERVNLKLKGKLPNRIFVVHRIDRDTSGLLLFAKDEEAKNLLQSKWNELVIERKYVGIVEGAPASVQGTVASWLKENAKSLIMESFPADDGSGEAKHAVTHFKVLGPWPVLPDGAKTVRYSRIEFDLETGRKNQIRVHCKDLRCPIAGDFKYGAKTDPLGRLALHAKTLVFKDPFTGAIRTFISPLATGF